MEFPFRFERDELELEAPELLSEKPTSDNERNKRERYTFIFFFYHDNLHIKIKYTNMICDLFINCSYSVQREFAGITFNFICHIHVARNYFKPKIENKQLKTNVSNNSIASF